MTSIDLLIVGGGINGAAIAREAALNGWSVLLVERGDLAGATSSASTKLIHGGLRYLESYEFRLVREALHERERLLHAAPHLIRPMLFVLPHAETIRPWWIVRAGLLLYDGLGGRSSLPRSRGLGKGDAAYQAPLAKPMRGFVYSDAWVDDSRLTVLNALDAAGAGAEVLTRTELGVARAEDGHWHAVLGDGRAVRARAVVNAAGPWVNQVAQRLGGNAARKLRLVKGSHIVVPRLFAGDHAYILQQPDRRIVFATPYLGAFTAIGTTDVTVDSAEAPRIDADETAYLCAATNRYFARQITPADVVSSWSGVRPLLDDGTAEAREVTRDYLLDLDTAPAPLLSIYGGKITTARALAEDAVGRLGPVLGRNAKQVTRDRPFPGGDMPDFAAFLADARRRWPFLGEARSERMARAYGTLLEPMLAGATGMGRAFGAGLSEVEARWLHDREWARDPEDVLMRRTKLGLHMNAGEQADFAGWWAETFG